MDYKFHIFGSYVRPCDDRQNDRCALSQVVITVFLLVIPGIRAMNL
jgi:hypothetical protein